MQFVKNNLKVTEIFLDKGEALAEACVVAEFNVPEGTLPTIEATASANRLVTSLQVSIGFSINGTTTLGEISACLADCNTPLRLLRPIYDLSTTYLRPIYDLITLYRRKYPIVISSLPA